MSRSFSLPFTEQLASRLCALYDRYGYARYKMNKFEEYDLYSRNKDFLISDGVITFTDTDGKLMALKPDVTLSIVHSGNYAPDATQKVYYNESVYRTSAPSRAFRELTQVGLECLGDVDGYCLSEVLLLAAESLRCIGKRCVLDVSHLGVLIEFAESCGIPSTEMNAVLRLAGEKNLHELSALCASFGLSDENTAAMCDLIRLHGTPDEVLPRLREIASGAVRKETLCGFESVIRSLDETEAGRLLRVDFSVVDNLNYYSGLVFKGFTEGVPDSVLSGGQYDRLMRRMKRDAGAVGFAVYLDRLEQLERPLGDYDADTLILYDDSVSLRTLHRLAAERIAAGERVTVRRAIPSGMKYRRLVRLKEGETTDENDA